jgi:hypothetical protein
MTWDLTVENHREQPMTKRSNPSLSSGDPAEAWISKGHFLYLRIHRIRSSSALIHRGRSIFTLSKCCTLPVSTLFSPEEGTHTSARDPPRQVGRGLWISFSPVLGDKRRAVLKKGPNSTTLSEKAVERLLCSELETKIAIVPSYLMPMGGLRLWTFAL